MGIYSKIYNNLCFSRCQSNKWKKGSGIHRHHIIPKHSGGSNEESNYCYLTIREHIIAHFLLWKIYKTPNDLRSMKMLGANITPAQRKIMGEYCRDNNIGFFGASKEQKFLWTIHLIENEGILASNCMKKRGGYSQEIQDTVVQFLKEEYDNLVSISPRGACNIADDMLNFPDSWREKTLSLNVFAWQGEK